MVWSCVEALTMIGSMFKIVSVHTHGVGYTYECEYGDMISILTMYVCTNRCRSGCIDMRLVFI